MRGTSKNIEWKLNEMGKRNEKAPGKSRGRRSMRDYQRTERERAKKESINER